MEEHVVESRIQRQKSFASLLESDPTEISKISPSEFLLFQKLVFDITGIYFAEIKQSLLVGRLAKRLKHCGLANFSDYFEYVSDKHHRDELQVMIDLLTTNETYFFREPQHFDFVREHAAQHRTGNYRVWSAAASSGEEAYSMAMILADTLGNRPWEVFGTDISQRMLAKAKRGHYALERIEGIPLHLLKRHCLKGRHDQTGTLLITRELRERVHFLYSNLLEPTGNLGMFDIIFLRNVLIYFKNETKRKVVANLLPYLKRDGFLVVGHSESLNGISDSLISTKPTIYRRAASC